MKKVLLVLLLLLSASTAFAQATIPINLWAPDSVLIHPTIITKQIVSGTTVTPGSPLKVPIKHGDGAYWSRYASTKFRILVQMDSAAANAKTKFEDWLADTVWTGSTFDTIRFTNRSMYNTTAMTFDSGSRLSLIAQPGYLLDYDSITYYRTHVDGTKIIASSIPNSALPIVNASHGGTGLAGAALNTMLFGNGTDTMGLVSSPVARGVLTAAGSPLAIQWTSALAGNQFLGSPNGTTGDPTFRAIAVADVPTLNQNTSGSAATLTTPRSIYGNNFDGSAALAQIIASTFGGTGNGFTKFSGPASSEKTFTLPNASATVLTDNAAVTLAQGGTGQTTQAAALKALTPDSTGNSGKFLGVAAGGGYTWGSGGSGLTNPMTITGDMIYSSSGSTPARLAIGGTGTLLTVSGGIPAYTTTTFPATTTINQILYSSSASVVGGITTANNDILATNGSGVPAFTATIPSAVQSNITATGTLTALTIAASAQLAFATTIDVGTTFTSLANFKNNNSATVGTPVQYAGIGLNAQGYSSGAGAAKFAWWYLINEPTSGTNITAGKLVFASLVQGGSTPVTAATLDTAGNWNVITGGSYQINGVKWLGGAPNTVTASPSNPTATSSGSVVMMGLNQTFTPATSGTVEFVVSGNINSGATGSPTTQIYYGTGSPPTNGAAVTGTAIGGKAVLSGLASGKDFVTLTGIATGLTAGTPYWFDIGMAVTGTASSSSVTDIYMQATELK